MDYQMLTTALRPSAIMLRCEVCGRIFDGVNVTRASKSLDFFLSFGI